MTHVAPTLSFQVQLQDATGLGLQALSEQLLKVLSTAGFAAITVSEDPEQAHDREASAATGRLDAVHEKLALPDGALDELTHDSGDDEMAANANNGGPNAQIRFLMDNGWTETNLKERMYDLWNDLYEGQTWVDTDVSSEDGRIEAQVNASGFLWTASAEYLTLITQDGGRGVGTRDLADAYRGHDPQIDAVFAYSQALKDAGAQESCGMNIDIDPGQLLTMIRARAKSSLDHRPLADRLSALNPETVTADQLKNTLA